MAQTTNPLLVISPCDPALTYRPLTGHGLFDMMFKLKFVFHTHHYQTIIHHFSVIQDADLTLVPFAFLVVMLQSNTLETAGISLIKTIQQQERF